MILQYIEVQLLHVFLDTHKITIVLFKMHLERGRMTLYFEFDQCNINKQPFSIFKTHFNKIRFIHVTIFFFLITDILENKIIFAKIDSHKRHT